MQRRGQPPPSPIIINGCRPLAITKAEFFQVLRSPRIGQRALYWTRRGQPFVKILTDLLQFRGRFDWFYSVGGRENLKM
jgi:hypothetical protein